MSGWRTRSNVFLLIGVAVALAAGWATTHWSTVSALAGSGAATQAAAQPAPTPVSIVEAREGDIEKVIAGIGSVSPLSTVTVRTQVDGEVKALPFIEGDLVEKGDVLARIDPVQLQAALAGAEAKKAQDQSQLENAQTESKRYTILAKQDSVSAEALDLKTSAVTQLEAVVKSDEAAVLSARDKLDDATIRSPITGRTGFRLVDIGGVVTASASTAIVTVTQLDPIGVIFVAPGDRFDEIRQAMKNDVAAVKALSTDSKRVLARGNLTLMDNNVDATNGSIKLRATFDNKDGALWPGLPVATRLTVAVQRGIVVPDLVLLRGVSGLYAYVVDSSGKVSRKPVESPFVTDGVALVTKGIESGDRIVSQGRDQVGEGTMVTISDPAESGAEANAGTAAAAKSAPQ